MGALVFRKRLKSPLRAGHWNLAAPSPLCHCVTVSLSPGMSPISFLFGVTIIDGSGLSSESIDAWRYPGAPGSTHLTNIVAQMFYSVKSEVGVDCVSRGREAGMQAGESDRRDGHAGHEPHECRRGRRS